MTKQYLKPPFGVVVQTWGASDDTTSSGMLHFCDTKLFGGNYGHAAVELRLPLSEMELVKKYCDKESAGRPAIPYEIQKSRIFGEQYIAVRFSWWPASDQSYRFQSLADDRIYEHGKHDVSKDTRLKDLPLQEIYVKGRLGEKKIKLAPMSLVIDEDGFTEFLNLHAQLQELEIQVQDLDYLISKYNPEKIEPSKNIKLSKTSKSYIQKLLGSDGVFSKLLEKSEFTKEDCIQLCELANKKKDTISQQIESVQKKTDEKSREIQKKITGIKDINLLDSKIKKLEKKIKRNKSPQATQKRIKELHFSKEQEKLWQEVSRILLEKKEQHVIVGLQEDANIHLPIGKDGMNTEAMLKEMREIVDKESFHLKYMNCSVVSARILKAGAPTLTLQAIAAQRAWGFFSNPQKIYNTAVHMQRSFTAWYTFLDTKIAASDFLYIDALVGFIIHKYIIAMKKDEEEHAKQNISAEDSQNKITWNKISAVLIVLPIIPIISVLYILNHILRPSLFIKDCSRLLAWVFENSSLFLKVVFSVVLLPAIIFHLIPALIETIIVGVFNILIFAKRGIVSLFQTMPADTSKEDLKEALSVSAEIAEEDSEQSPVGVNTQADEGSANPTTPWTIQLTSAMLLKNQHKLGNDKTNTATLHSYLDSLSSVESDSEYLDCLTPTETDLDKASTAACKL